MASAVVNELAQISDVATGASLARFRHPNAVRALTFGPDGNVLVTGGADNVVRVFAERGGWRETASFAFREPVEWVGLSPDSSHVVAASRAGVRIFDARTGIERMRLAHANGIASVAVSPDGTVLAVASFLRSVQVLELPPANHTVAFDPAASPAGPDGLAVRAMPGGGSAVVQEVKTGKQVATFEIGDASLGMSCFAAGGTLAIVQQTSGQEVNEAKPGRLTAFEWRSGRKVWERSDSTFWQVHCSPDGQTVATFNNRQLALLDARTGRMARVEQQATVNSIAFDARSARIATGADDGYARVYNIADGTEVARMPLGEKVQHVQFERDGWLKATTYTFDSYLWESYFRYALAPTMARDLIAAACKRLTRNLTADEWSNYVGGTYRETCPELSALAARNSGTIRTR